ncbi:aminotransferase [Anopheles sinensis]|uniref:Aminotransferase n=1 Tax=Anopheles sinensis TaxID=74873 RepID=A0A084VRA8_ANOSI|nr:aminotransferase [Anopheles sinensis]
MRYLTVRPLAHIWSVGCASTDFGTAPQNGNDDEDDDRTRHYLDRCRTLARVKCEKKESEEFLHLRMVAGKPKSRSSSLVSPPSAETNCINIPRRGSATGDLVRFCVQNENAACGEHRWNAI